jgi:hypothetical protein
VVVVATQSSKRLHVDIKLNNGRTNDKDNQSPNHQIQPSRHNHQSKITHLVCDSTTHPQLTTRREARRALESLKAELVKCQTSEANVRLQLKETIQQHQETSRAMGAEASLVGAAKAAATKEVELLRVKLARLGEEVVAERREREQLAKKCDQVESLEREIRQRRLAVSFCS